MFDCLVCFGRGGSRSNTVGRLVSRVGKELLKLPNYHHLIYFLTCLFPLLYLVDDMMGDFAILPHTQYIVPQNDVGNNGDIDNHEAANNVDLPV